MQLSLFETDHARLIAIIIATAQARQAECSWSPTPYSTWLALHFRPGDYGLSAEGFRRAYNVVSVGCGNLPGFVLERV